MMHFLECKEPILLGKRNLLKKDMFTTKHSIIFILDKVPPSSSKPMLLLFHIEICTFHSATCRS